MEKKKKNDFIEEDSCSYDERAHTFTVTKTFTRKGLVSIMSNVYSGEKEIKQFLKSQQDGKASGEKRLLAVKDKIQRLKDEQIEIKGLAKLTDSQKQLIEDLRIVTTYEAYDKFTQDIKLEEENLTRMQEKFKKDNIAFEKQKQTCKIKT